MRLTRFAISFVLGFCLVMLLSLLPPLIQAAPGRANVPFIGIAIDPGVSAPIVYLPNQLFQCTALNQQSRCEATLKGHPLQITIVQTPDRIDTSEICRATYADKIVVCQSGRSFYTQRGFLQFYFLNGNLGFTVAQLQDLQQQYWLTNQLGIDAEVKLAAIALGYAGIGAMLAIGISWLNGNGLARILSSLSSGYVLALTAWGLLILVPAANPVQYGISEAAWQTVGLPIVVTAAGTVGTILAGVYLSRRPGGAINVIVSLLMGYAIALVTWYALLVGFPLVGANGSWLTVILSPLIGVAAVVLLLARTERSLKIFSWGVSGLGGFLIVLTLLHHILNLRVQDY